MFFKPELDFSNVYNEPEPPDQNNLASSLDVAKSAWESTRTRFPYADWENIRDAYDEHIKRVKELTGTELANPESQLDLETFNKGSSYDTRQEKYKALSQYKSEGGELDDASFIRQYNERAFRQQLEELAQKRPDLRSQLLPEQSFISQGYGRLRSNASKSSEVFERSNKGALDYMAFYVTPLAAGFQDPINVMTLPLGFGGVGTGIKGILMGGLKAGTANALVEAAEQPFIQRNYDRAGLPSGLKESATDIAYAFGGGALVDMGIRGTYRAIAPRFGYTPIVKDGIVVAWRRGGLRGPHSVTAEPLEPVPDIPTDIREKAAYGDKEAQAEVDRLLSGKPAKEATIPAEVMRKASEGDAAAIRQVYEPDAKYDPAIRQWLDAMDANERLSIKPIELVDDITHAQTVTQTLRHVYDPETEPLPVRVDITPPETGIRAKLDGEVQSLKEQLAKTPDDVEVSDRLAAVEAQVQAIDAFGSNPIRDAEAIRANPEIVTADIPAELPGVRQARALAALSDDAFALVKTGKAPAELGAMVANFVAEPAQHARMLTDLTARRPVAPEDARRILSELLASPDYAPRPPELPGPVSEAAGSPRQLDDPYGAEAKAQVARLEREMQEELASQGRADEVEMLATPEGQAAAIARVEPVKQAIADLAGIIPADIRVQAFSSIDDLPSPLRAKIRAGNAAIYQEALTKFQAAKSLDERLAAKRLMDSAGRGEGIEGIHLDNDIWIASYAMNPKGRLAHEVLHALKTTGRLSPEEIKVLADAARESGIWNKQRESLYEADYSARMDEAAVKETLEEEAAAHYVEAAVNGDLPTPPTPQALSIVERLKAFFAQIRATLMGQGFRPVSDDAVNPAQDVVSALLAGKIAEREQRADWMRGQADPAATRAVMEGQAAMKSAAEKGTELPDGTVVNGVHLLSIRGYHGTTSWDGGPARASPEKPFWISTNKEAIDTSYGEGLKQYRATPGENPQTLEFDVVADKAKEVTFDELDAMSPAERKAAGIVKIKMSDDARKMRGDVYAVFDSNLISTPDGTKVKGVPLYAITAYHGSPHEFDKFSTVHIGKGEGAQAYGHGLYFAEREAVAKSYRDLADATINGRPFDPDNALHRAVQMVDEFGSRDAAINDATGRAARDPGDYWRRVISHLSSDRALPEMMSKGHLYQVRINADPEDFLDWDKPLSGQSEKVKGALANVGYGTPQSRSVDQGVSQVLRPSTSSAEDAAQHNIVGSDILDALARKTINGDWGPPRDFARAQASQKLKELGIAGIRYLDQGSRSKGEGSYNYVVFDDSLVEIIGKNGKLIERVAAAQAPAPPNPVADIQAAFSDITPGDPDMIAKLTERVPALVNRYRGAELDTEATAALVNRTLAATANGENFQDALARELADYYQPTGGKSEPLYAMSTTEGRKKPGADKRAEDLNADLIDIELALKGASIDDREALQRKRASLINAKAHEVGIEDVYAYKNARGEQDPATAFLKLHETHGEGGAADLASLKQVIQDEALQKMAEVMWTFRKGAVLGDLRRTVNQSVKAKMDNVIREAAGEKTGDAAAARMAKAWVETAEWLRQSFNADGGDIGKLNGWFAPQHHDADALLRAGRDTWVDFLMKPGVLDRDRMTRLDGTALSDKELRDVLREIWVTITTDGANKRDAAGYRGNGALYKRHAEHRVLHFKNADAFLAYARDFGSADPYSMMIGHINMMARDIASLRRFGANPEVVRERIKQQIIIDAETDVTAKSLYQDLTEKVDELRAVAAAIPDKADVALKKLGKLHEELDALIGKPRKKAQREALGEKLGPVHDELKDALSNGPLTPDQLAIYNDITGILDEMYDVRHTYKVVTSNPVERVNRLLQRADEMWKVYSGTTNTPLDTRMASVMSGIRNVISAGTLPFASISALSDQATGMAARAFVGMPVTRQLGSFIKGFTKEDRKFALRAGLGLDQAMAAFTMQSRFVGYVNTRSITGYLADRTHAFSFLSPMTQAAKVAFGIDFMSWMADLAATKSFKGLEPWTRDMWLRHGLTEADWSTLKRVAPETHRGVPVLTQGAIAASGGDELADKFMRMLLRERAQAVLEPTIQGRTAFISESKPGTVMGELTRSVAMLKSFPTSYMMLIMGRAYNEIVAGRGARANTIAYMTAILVGGTLLGAMAKQMKNVSQGRDPEDMSSPNFWAKSFMQAGGLGIYGDFIANSVNRNGGGLAQTIMGPVADRGATVLDATVGNIVQYAKDEKTNAGREMVRILRQNTPGAFVPFYLRSAYERMILDELQKMVDPDAHKSFRSRINATKKLSGTEYYWPPGSPVPSRGPDFGAAFGGRQ